MLVYLAHLLVKGRRAAVTDPPTAKESSVDKSDVAADDPTASAIACSTSTASSGNKKTAASAAKKRNCTTIELSALATSHLLSLLSTLSYISDDAAVAESKLHDFLVKFDAGKCGYALR